MKSVAEWKNGNQSAEGSMLEALHAAKKLWCHASRRRRTPRLIAAASRAEWLKQRSPDPSWSFRIAGMLGALADRHRQSPMAFIAEYRTLEALKR
ncbi:hypothetical protein [Rhizobium sp. YTU87027]|uniref:hypothetical protein n=1 Tax=Rhizobium sp. YTU87027 TaxID=3417741 RepID=UPI003D680B13